MKKAVEPVIYQSEWLDELDRRLMREVINPDPILLRAFRYFDTLNHFPLTPRELLQFVGVLSEQEKLEFVFFFSE